jgi:endonuclease/exonuclease/phosphatase family metal-dependent hydrolase
VTWTPDRATLATGLALLALVAGGGYVHGHDARPASAPTRTRASAATSSAVYRSSPAPSPAATPVRAPAPALDFTISSFNVLGASHTTGSGKRPAMASGRVRAVRAAALVRRHGADVVGFQELQASQLATLQRTTDLDFYPGFRLRRPDTENSIGWRRSHWTAVETRTVRIPYFDGGWRAMPVVRLRSTSTGLEAWFANFHNPADTARFHHQQRFRDRATAIEVAVADELVRSRLPVFVTGDMNERASYFCRFTGRTAMVAARGGENADGRCRAGRPRAVDWVFGSPDVTFTGYSEDRSHLVDITTDHPVISARARIVGTATSR